MAIVVSHAARSSTLRQRARARARARASSSARACVCADLCFGAKADRMGEDVGVAGSEAGECAMSTGSNTGLASSFSIWAPALGGEGGVSR